MSFIETRDLCQRRGETTTLRGVSLKIEKGEVFGIIGPSGAGKTTLLRLLSLIEKPSSGKIFFDGQDTDQPEGITLAMRRRLAFLQQKPVVFNMSVYDNIAYGLRCRGVHKDTIRQKVGAVLETGGLTGYEKRRARTLSGGEMQRVAIVRALVLEPEVLLLDELTANLDPLSSSKIEELLIAIIRKRTTTIVIATHDMAQGQKLADRIGVIIKGELMQAGETSSVFTSPVNKEVADFVGVENVIPGRVIAVSDGLVTVSAGENRYLEVVADCNTDDRVFVLLRPEDIILSLTRMSTSARNSFETEIVRMLPRGPLVRVELDGSCHLIALITRRSAEEMGLGVGKKAFASFKATAAHLIRRS